jgi:thiopeptide-type bacteriocin biosynthesis protein
MKSEKKSGLKILDFALCRTPVFSLQDKLNENWIKFTELIRDSSPAFYSTISSCNTQSIDDVTDKVKFSIWKYFNRARHRATPYGGFAAVSTVSISDGDTASPVIDRGMIMHNFIDWKEKEKCTSGIRQASLFEINSFVYKIGSQYRYLLTRDGIFEIAVVDSFNELDTVLNLCKAKSSKAAIYDTMTNSFGMNASETDDFLTQMTGLQLLFTDLSSNITGEDYFKRTGFDKKGPANNYYTIAERKISGTLNSAKLKDLKDAIRFLSLNLPRQVNNDLGSFKKAFLKKFEQKAVPLALVMDLETGIGYGNLGQQQQNHELVDFILSEKETQQPVIKNAPFTPIHSFLLNRVIAGGTIKLENFKQQEPADTSPISNTLSVLLHFFGDNAIIESCGGCTANAMLGRFTISSSEIEKFGLQVAELEQQANPDIIFFDIAYQAEKQVDNVNRRKKLYQYELPILTWSCDDNPIHFDDILVAVRNDEVILWSKKHKKRMVPRIASAYNYSRSDLAVYRFLCDLQHQHLKSDLNFRIREFLPGLMHYPRVVYKSVILSPAMWLVPPELLVNSKEQKIKLLNWLQEQGINFPFKAGNTDQTLCFDPAVTADMDAFLFYCNQHAGTELYLTEALVSTDMIKDKSGNDYAAQFVVHLNHGDNIYKSYQLENYHNEAGKNGMVLPGGDWLYFEIYCHPYRADSLLHDTIKTFLKTHKTHIYKWFFIRYTDPAPHIRLRLHLKDQVRGYEIINSLKALLEPDCKAGLIADMQIKTYFKEADRYGIKQMPLVEQLFCYDSQHALKLLNKKLSMNQVYASTLCFMQELIGTNLPVIADQITFAKALADSFSNEFNLKPDGFKKLNQAYKEIKPHLNNVSTQVAAKYKQLFIKVMESCETASQRNKLLADLLHMHINRLFSSNQRTHELILYHYLLKILVTQRACTKAQLV